MPDMYMFAAKSENIRAFVRLNGFPLFDSELDKPRDRSRVVTMWIMEEANKLEVSLAVAPNVARAGAKFELALRRVADGQDRQTAPAVVELSWPPENLKELIPYYQVFEFAGPDSSACRLWRDAETIVIDEQIEAELRAFGEHLHRMFAAGDFVGLAKRMEYRGRDLAACVGMSDDEGISSQADFFESIMNQPSFKALPLSPDGVTVLLLAENKVAWLRRGKETLLENATGQGSDVFVARINGEWQAVR